MRTKDEMPSPLSSPPFSHEFVMASFVQRTDMRRKDGNPSIYKNKTRFRDLGLVKCLWVTWFIFSFLATSVYAGQRPLSRIILGRTCYGILVRVGLLADPRKVRAHRNEMTEAIKNLTDENERRGMPRKEAEFTAKAALLKNLGYDSSLIGRWNKSDPKLLDRILLNLDNKPITGYHGIFTSSADSYNPRYPGFPGQWGRNHYFLFSEKGALSFTGNGKRFNNGIGIIAKYQIPNFGWATEIGGAGLKSDAPPVSFPAVQFANDPTLFTTHLKFPAYSDKWYKWDEVVFDGKMILPPEIGEQFQKVSGP